MPELNRTNQTEALAWMHLGMPRAQKVGVHRGGRGRMKRVIEGEQCSVELIKLTD